MRQWAAVCLPGANYPLGLAAGRESNVALLVDKDGEAEGEALHAAGCEPELVYEHTAQLRPYFQTFPRNAMTPKRESKQNL